MLHQQAKSLPRCKLCMHKRTRCSVLCHVPHQEDTFHGELMRLHISSARLQCLLGTHAVQRSAFLQEFAQLLATVAVGTHSGTLAIGDGRLLGAARNGAQAAFSWILSC